MADARLAANSSRKVVTGVASDSKELVKLSSFLFGIIADAVSILRVRAQEKGIDLRCRWQSRVPESIVTDPSRFRQLLMNLIGNAIKFTDEGSVEVLARMDASLRLR